MATVYCTKTCLFYIDDELVDETSERETGLTPGLTYTPSAHMPDYDSSVYTEYKITYQRTDYTTGSFTCPDNNFMVTYNFYGYSTSSVWKLGNTYSLKNISEPQTQDLSFGKAGYVARFTLTFAKSGTVNFYTIGSSDSYGYLSTTSSFDEDTGGPTSSLKKNDDGGSGNNFKISYDVVEGTTYYLWVRMIDITTPGSTTVCIDPAWPLYDLWDWNASNGDATAAQTRIAYEAITGGGAVSDFNYLVWNDLVNKVNDMKSETGFPWNTKYLSLSNTRVTTSDKTLTADRFNSLQYNIGIHESTGLNDVYAGNEVYGWYFTNLTDALNTWINTLNGN